MAATRFSGKAAWFVLIGFVVCISLAGFVLAGQVGQEKPGTRLAIAVQGLGVHEHQAGGVDVELLELKRTSGDTVTARWQYRNKTNERKQLTDQRTGWPDPYRLAFEVYLLDGNTRTKYVVIRDEKNYPVAGRHGGQNSFIFIGPKETISTWAKFQAPPETTEKITVVIPGVQPFEDIPISK